MKKTETKTCIYCKRQKPIEEFSNHPLASDGKMKGCKVCNRNRRTSFFAPLNAYSNEEATR